MILLLILWILFYFLHSFFASLGVKEYFRQKWPAYYRYYRIGYNLFAIISFMLIWVYQLSLPVIYMLEEKKWLQFSGYGLMAAGTIAGIIALMNYDLSEFAGTKQLRHKNAADDPGQLVISGFNGIVRHPLYFAGLLFFTGFLLAYFTLPNLIFVSVSVIYLYVGAKLEERKLEKVFGEQYSLYKKKVKMLIPFIF